MAVVTGVYVVATSVELRDAETAGKKVQASEKMKVGYAVATTVSLMAAVLVGP